MWNQNEEKNKFLKLVYLAIFLLFIIFSFFPFSLILLFFAWSIKNYFVSEFQKIWFKSRRTNKNYNSIQEIYDDYSAEELQKMAEEHLVPQSGKNEKIYMKNESVYTDTVEDKKIENIKNKNTSFYEQNTNTLKDKLLKEARTEKKHTNITKNHSWKKDNNFSKKSDKNYFGNSAKKSSTFGSWKSIWDNYESVTKNFTNKKSWK